MIHLRKGKKSLCGKALIPRDPTATSFPKHVTCSKCIISLEVRARKQGEKTDKKNLKSLEKETTALWRKIVWTLWGGHCALCKRPCNDHNAHHYFTKSAHAIHRYEPGCGILLCYGCHIGKIHRGGEVESIRQLIIDKIGETAFESLRERAYDLAKYDEGRLLSIRDVLKVWHNNLREE